MLFWYALALVLFLVFSCEYYALKTGVPTVTSFPAIRKRMIQVLKDEAAAYNGAPPFTIFDLGSGTGKLALEIGRALPQARVIGIELSWAPYFLSRLRQLLWRVRGVTFRRDNFWDCDLSSAQAVTIYMTDKIRLRMERKLREELPAGSLVILNESHLPGWTPLEVFKEGLFNADVVVYRKEPALS